LIFGFTKTRSKQDTDGRGVYYIGRHNAYVSLSPERPPGQQPGGYQPKRHGGAGEPLLSLWGFDGRKHGGRRPAVQVQRQGTGPHARVGSVRLRGKAL